MVIGAPIFILDKLSLLNGQTLADSQKGYYKTFDKKKAQFPIWVGKSFCYFNFKMGLLQNLKFESTFSYGENGVY